MKKGYRCLFALVMAIAMTCYACAAGQQGKGHGSESMQAPPQSAMVFQGSLVEVNTEAKTLTVKNSENKEMQFAFTETTEIVGAQNNAQGLAGKAGERVKITYTTKQGVNQASRVEILPYY